MVYPTAAAAAAATVVTGGSNPAEGAAIHVVQLLAACTQRIECTNTHDNTHATRPGRSLATAVQLKVLLYTPCSLHACMEDGAYTHTRTQAQEKTSWSHASTCCSMCTAAARCTHALCGCTHMHACSPVHAALCIRWPAPCSLLGCSLPPALLGAPLCFCSLPPALLGCGTCSMCIGSHGWQGELLWRMGPQGSPSPTGQNSGEQRGALYSCAAASTLPQKRWKEECPCLAAEF